MNLLDLENAEKCAFLSSIGVDPAEIRPNPKLRTVRASVVNAKRSAGRSCKDCPVVGVGKDGEGCQPCPSGKFANASADGTTASTSTMALASN